MTEQEKREKVIKGLMCIAGDVVFCAHCKYSDVNGSGRGDRCKRDCAKDALALLKAQEPRVLSVADIIDEHITPDIIWVERRHENDICAGVWQIDHYEMALEGVIDDLGEEIAERPDAYNTLWRCWTARPTDEQREAVPWE